MEKFIDIEFEDDDEVAVQVEHDQQREVQALTTKRILEECGIFDYERPKRGSNPASDGIRRR